MNGQEPMSEKRDAQQQAEKAQWSLTLRQGLLIFGIFLACLVTFFFFYRLKEIVAYVSSVFTALSPIFYGLIIAYLLNGPMMFFRRLYYNSFSKKNMTDARARKLAKGLSVATAIACAVLVIVGICFLIIPQLVSSLMQLVDVVPDQLEGLMAAVNEHQNSDNAITRYLVDIFYTIVNAIQKWLSEADLASKLGDIFVTVTGYVTKALNVVFDFIVAIVVSIYLLIDKEKLCGQVKKMMYALMPPKRVNSILSTMRHAHTIFGKFIVGILVDALIVGFVTFISLSILRVPYPLLIGVIVGATNVIPFFGPFIGAIPSAILIFIMKPVKVIHFVIFVVILQQIDGNILNPMIVGDSTGVSEFWVMFSLLLFGNIFGVFGMVIAVPLFAVLAYLVRLGTDKRLDKKKMPTDSQKYEAVISYDPKKRIFLYNCKDEFLVYPRGDKEEGNIEYHIVHRRRPKEDET